MYFILNYIQCPPLILAPLVNMSKGSCENKSALFILFIFHSKNSQISNLSLKVKQLKVGGGSHCEINAFTISCGHNYWHPIIATSFSQHNSSEFSPIMPEEFGEHPDKRSETIFFIQESLQILQIHSSMTVLLLFSSPHSSSTGFRSEDRDSNGKRFILCSVTHFCVYFDVCFGLLVLVEDPHTPIIRFLTAAVRFWFFICWYLIESILPCIWTRCSDLQQKNRPTT